MAELRGVETTGQQRINYFPVMEAISIVLALRERNPPVIGEFPSQWDNSVELWRVICC